MAPRAAPSCRFAVGTRVMCNLGKWQEATIIALNYKEGTKVAPYQVSLTNSDDSAKLFVVPADTNAYVRSFDERRSQSGLHLNFKELLDFCVTKHNLPIQEVCYLWDELPIFVPPEEIPVPEVKEQPTAQKEILCAVETPLNTQASSTPAVQNRDDQIYEIVYQPYYKSPEFAT